MHTPEEPVEATLHMEGYAGRLEKAVEIIGETPKRYRLRALEPVRLPTGLVWDGDVFLAPKYAVTIKAASSEGERDG